MNEREIKEVFKPFLWFYDINKIDFERDKKRIITNVLNLGTKEATDLLFEIYSKKDINEVVTSPLPGEWNKKSLNYWRLIFGVNDNELPKRIIPNY